MNIFSVVEKILFQIMNWSHLKERLWSLAESIFRTTGQKLSSLLGAKDKLLQRIGRFITEFFTAIHQGKNSGINWMRFFFDRGHFRTVVRWEFRRLVLIAEDITRLRFMPLSKVVRGDEYLRLKIAARKAVRRFRIVLQETILGRSRFMFWDHLRSKNKSWVSFGLRSLVRILSFSRYPTA